MKCRCIKNFQRAGLIYHRDSEFVYKSSLMVDGKYAYFIYGDNNFMRDEKMWYRLYDKEFYEYFYSLNELRREKLKKLSTSLDWDNAAFKYDFKSHFYTEQEVRKIKLEKLSSL